MTTISIIGSAGRNEAFSFSLYQKAYKVLKTYLTAYEDIHLVSGGAAGADHLAVSLYKETKLPLHLHLPAKFSYKEHAYDSNSKDGSTANYWHCKFSKDCGFKPRHTLSTLSELLSSGSIISTVHEGFLKRNVPVSQSDVIIAFTFGDTQPPPGGTRHTWNLAKDKERIHISLPKL
jgi:hypothetical protein